jgi:hypothetical protein
VRAVAIFVASLKPIRARFLVAARYISVQGYRRISHGAVTTLLPVRSRPQGTVDTKKGSESTSTGVDSGLLDDSLVDNGVGAMTTILYARVSTIEQTIEHQRRH